MSKKIKPERAIKQFRAKGWPDSKIAEELGLTPKEVYTQRRLMGLLSEKEERDIREQRRKWVIGGAAFTAAAGLGVGFYAGFNSGNLHERRISDETLEGIVNWFEESQNSNKKIISLFPPENLDVLANIAWYKQTKDRWSKEDQKKVYSSYVYQLFHTGNIQAKDMQFTMIAEGWLRSGREVVFEVLRKAKPAGDASKDYMLVRMPDLVSLYMADFHNLNKNEADEESYSRIRFFLQKSPLYDGAPYFRLFMLNALAQSQSQTVEPGLREAFLLNLYHDLLSTSMAIDPPTKMNIAGSDYVRFLHMHNHNDASVESPADLEKNQMVAIYLPKENSYEFRYLYGGKCVWSRKMEVPSSLNAAWESNPFNKNSEIRHETLQNNYMGNQRNLHIRFNSDRGLHSMVIMGNDGPLEFRLMNGAKEGEIKGFYTGARCVIATDRYGIPAAVELQSPK